MKKKVLITVILALFVLILCGAASAKTIQVTPSTGIQKTIDKATNGDTLSLSTGTYKEHDITVNKNLIITGPPTTGTPPTAVIDAEQKGRVFNVPSGIKTTLEYLTIVNGNANKDTTNPIGGGIYNQGKLTVSHCILHKNTAHTGGGILNKGTCTVTLSQIKVNTAINGGGICNYYGTTETRSWIFSNTATNTGGGIYNYYGTFTDTGSWIYSNTAYNGGGIRNSAGTFTFISSGIKDNTATNSGGGILNDNGNCTVIGRIIKGNTAKNGFGGGIYNTGNCHVNICEFILNSAKAGAGIANFNKLDVKNSTFDHNNGVDYGGGIFSDGTLKIINSKFSYNNAYCGGAIITNKTCIAIGNNFVSNYARDYGGAIHCEGGNNLTMMAQYNRFYLNSAGVAGHGIYCKSGSMDARYNWWGSNAQPTGKVYAKPGSSINTDNWLILKINANPTLIGKNIKSQITADLTYDVMGVPHYYKNGHFPNGVPVSFSTTLGSINTPVSTINGIATAYLTSGSTIGVATVTASLDKEKVSTSVRIVNPDLIMDGIIVDSSIPEIENGNLKLHCFIRNQGNKDVKNYFKIKYYLSQDMYWSTNDHYLGDYLVTQGINAGGSLSINPGFGFTTSIPKGAYYIIANVDCDYNIGESNEVNNVRCFGPKIWVPYLFNDLEMISISAPASGTIGSTIQSESVYKNRGNAIIIKDFIIRYYLSKDQILSSNDYFLGDLPQTNLAAGSMIYEYPKFKIPSSVTAGLYYVLAYVDFTKKISESNENNNFKASVSKVNINDKTAPKVSSTVPINNMMGYNRTSSILIKFTENITTSTYYNSIKIKNLTTNKDVELTKAISGNTLALKTSTRTANTWYQVTIPLAAVRDLAGNNLTTTYSFKFKTGA